MYYATSQHRKRRAKAKAAKEAMAVELDSNTVSVVELETPTRLPAAPANTPVDKYHVSTFEDTPSSQELVVYHKDRFQLAKELQNALIHMTPYLEKLDADDDLSSPDSIAPSQVQIVHQALQLVATVTTFPALATPQSSRIVYSQGSYLNSATAIDVVDTPQGDTPSSSIALITDMPDVEEDTVNRQEYRRQLEMELRNALVHTTPYLLKQFTDDNSDEELDAPVAAAPISHAQIIHNALQLITTDTTFPKLATPYSPVVTIGGKSYLAVATAADNQVERESFVIDFDALSPVSSPPSSPKQSSATSSPAKEDFATISITPLDKTAPVASSLRSLFDHEAPAEELYSPMELIRAVPADEEEEEAAAIDVINTPLTVASPFAALSSPLSAIKAVIEEIDDTVTASVEEEEAIEVEPVVEEEEQKKDSEDMVPAFLTLCGYVHKHGTEGFGGEQLPPLIKTQKVTVPLSVTSWKSLVAYFFLVFLLAFLTVYPMVVDCMKPCGERHFCIKKQKVSFMAYEAPVWKDLYPIEDNNTCKLEFPGF